MKYLITALLTMLFAAACSDRGAPSTTDEPAMNAAVEPPREEAASERRLRAPLPEGIELDFGHRVRDDRIIERDGRPDRRRINLAYTDGDQASVFARLDRSLLAAGFSQSDRNELGSGNTRVKYRKPGFGRVIVTVTPVEQARDGGTVGEGTVLLDLPAKD